MSDSEELAVLRALRLKGRAGTEDLVAATGLSAGAVTAVTSGLLAEGGAKEMRGALVLLAPARDRLETLLVAEREGVEESVIAAAYEDFTAVNHDFKSIASDWQMRGEEVNDHTDPAYDGQVLSRLPGVHARVTPILETVIGQAARLAPYQDRLNSALDKVRAGDHTWLLKPLIDSYHTVWFELHEELISLAGLTRLEEAAAGRAR